MENRQTFNQQLIQWASAYARAPINTENEPFNHVRSIIREMEFQKIAKPIIFYHIMMVLQSLTCVLKLQFTEIKIKKILAVLYPDDIYVSDLTKQVISAISSVEISTELLNRTRLQNTQMQNTYGPPPGPYA